MRIEKLLHKDLNVASLRGGSLTSFDNEGDHERAQ